MVILDGNKTRDVKQASAAREYCEEALEKNLWPWGENDIGGLWTGDRGSPAQMVPNPSSFVNTYISRKPVRSTKGWWEWQTTIRRVILLSKLYGKDK